MPKLHTSRQELIILFWGATPPGPCGTPPGPMVPPIKAKPPPQSNYLSLLRCREFFSVYYRHLSENLRSVWHPSKSNGAAPQFTWYGHGILREPGENFETKIQVACRRPLWPNRDLLHPITGVSILPYLSISILLKNLPPYRKAKKIQVRIIRFGCNLGHLIAYLCRL